MSTTTPPTPNSSTPANGDNGEHNRREHDCPRGLPVPNDPRHPGLYVTINYSPQIAHGGGSNAMATGDATTIGSPTVKDNAALVGSRTANGDLHIVNGSDGVPKEKLLPGGWWQRWRKRGLVVALATIVAAVISLLTYLGVTPWS